MSSFLRWASTATTLRGSSRSISAYTRSATKSRFFTSISYGNSSRNSSAHRKTAIRWRYFTSASSRRQYAGPYEAARAAAKEKNRTTMYYGASTIIATLALAYGSVPLYKMICQQTGWSGQPVKAHDVASDIPASERLKPVEDHRRLRITFNGSVSDILPWKFTPQQREVRVLPGETALAFYTATNKSEADIIGVATYSVTPAQVAPYFSKIQCFCFEEQKLNAGETVDMPVFFYIDPEFARDPNMKGIDSVTLSYCFFKAKYDKNGMLTTIPGALAMA